MIDKKIMNRIVRSLSLTNSVDCRDVSKQELLELIELAHIGIWAREVGIPTLKSVKYMLDPPYDASHVRGVYADAIEALSKLPNKQEEK